MTAELPRQALDEAYGYDYNNSSFEDKGNGINVLKQDHGTDIRTNRYWNRNVGQEISVFVFLKEINSNQYIFTSVT